MLLKSETKGHVGGATPVLVEETDLATISRPIEGLGQPIDIKLESFMRTFNPLVLLVLLVNQSASTQAADLNGAWTIDASACGEVFTKESGRCDRPGKANNRHISKMYCQIVA